MTKRLSLSIALLTALAAIGGLIGFQAGGPSPPEAIAAAEGAAPAPAAPATITPWTAPDQEAAKKRAQELAPFVEAVMEECDLCRQMRLRETGLGIKDITHNYFLLDSPIIKKTEDLYGPVRFKHSKHAAQLKDCALCHHRRPLDAQAKETTRCSACHQESFRPDQPERL
ncbi:MAG: cytochrome c family protein, partial [Desulfobacterales bacterium]|nr:cytochrome c family protein [Desulfobacterales bacterium]